jgi:small-conductance mechanosensitive channel
VQTGVQVAYGTDVRALQPLLQAAIATVPRVIADPAPAVQLSAFSADGMDLVVNFWIGDVENGQGNVKSEVNLAVLDVLNAQGIEIPFPQRVVHAVVTKRPPEEGDPALAGQVPSASG